MTTFEPWQWAVLIAGAVLVGVSKTGIAGLGMLFVTLFTLVIPAKQATGLVLPLLCFGDIIAVISYRQHADWRHLWRLFPWTAIGVLIGYFALGRIDNHGATVLIGAIVVALVALHVWRRWRGGGRELEHGAWFAPTIGVLAGFTTFVANAAGPLMAIYLLAMGLPKMKYVGTAAVFFLLINWFKAPFMVHLGMITTASFVLNLKLAPAVFVGTWFGRMIVARIEQRWFENIALVLSGAAGALLLLRH